MERIQIVVSTNHVCYHTNPGCYTTGVAHNAQSLTVQKTQNAHYVHSLTRDLFMSTNTKPIRCSSCSFLCRLGILPSSLIMHGKVLEIVWVAPVFTDVSAWNIEAMSHYTCQCMTL